MARKECGDRPLKQIFVFDEGDKTLGIQLGMCFQTSFLWQRHGVWFIIHLLWHNSYLKNVTPTNDTFVVNTHQQREICSCQQKRSPRHCRVILFNVCIQKKHFLFNRIVFQYSTRFYISSSSLYSEYCKARWFEK